MFGCLKSQKRKPTLSLVVGPWHEEERHRLIDQIFCMLLSYVALW